MTNNVWLSFACLRRSGLKMLHAFTCSCFSCFLGKRLVWRYQLCCHPLPRRHDADLVSAGEWREATWAWWECRMNSLIEVAYCWISSFRGSQVHFFFLQDMLKDVESILFLLTLLDKTDKTRWSAVKLCAQLSSSITRWCCWVTPMSARTIWHPVDSHVPRGPVTSMSYYIWPSRCCML